MENHFQQFEFMFFKLASSGGPIFTKNKVGNLLRSLPDSFYHIYSVYGHLEFSYGQMRSSVSSEIDRKLPKCIMKDK